MGTGGDGQQTDAGKQQNMDAHSSRNLLDLKECVQDSPSFR